MKIIVLGKGLVGGALINRLSSEHDYQVVGINRSDCDLRDYNAVKNLFEIEKPEIVILAAGIVGGIEENLASPAELILENSRIILNVISAAISSNIPRLINLVPACVFPVEINRRMRPEDLFTAPMESSSLPYSTAKLAGIVMVNAARTQFGFNWISLISTNLYGSDSTIEAHKAHVIPALIAKFTEAKNLGLHTITLLGDGSPIREFLHVEDLADAIIKVIQADHIHKGVMNIAGDENITISTLAEMVKDAVGFEGSITFAADGKNGAPCKLLEGSEIQELGWVPQISLKQGLKRILS